MQSGESKQVFILPESLPLVPIAKDNDIIDTIVISDYIFKFSFY